MKLTLNKMPVDLVRRAPVYTKQMHDKQQFPQGVEPTEIIPHLPTLSSPTLVEMLDTPDE